MTGFLILLRYYTMSNHQVCEKIDDSSTNCLLAKLMGKESSEISCQVQMIAIDTGLEIIDLQNGSPLLSNDINNQVPVLTNNVTKSNLFCNFVFPKIYCFLWKLILNFIDSMTLYNLIFIIWIL